MADIIKAAAASAVASGQAGYGGFAAYDLKSSSAGKPCQASVKSMGQALPQLSVRARGPGCDICWEDFNYPPVLRLVHFDMTELPMQLRRTVRLLNLSFLLTSFVCLLNTVDTAILVLLGSVPVPWLIQSVLLHCLLPPAALGTFYLGYRGLAAPEPLLAYRFQFAQLGLGLLSVVLAVFPNRCVNGLVRLAYLDMQGMGVFQSIVVLVESFLWMLNACLALFNWSRVRRMNLLPTGNTPTNIIQ